ncbi:MAG TPA: glycosyl hydrolase [Chitinophagaceae bacterium]|nr:glycosyl hydrolase [Chitinophagaceae bacterium]
MRVKHLKRTCFIIASVAAFFSLSFKHANFAPPKTGVDGWFPRYDFDANTFKKPNRSFGPFTRWWWPGNDVTNEELQREIKLFAANDFAGVEIEPFAAGINLNGPADQLARQLSWDSASFYQHVAAVMEQAKLSAITVDMNAGSGWPMGGPFIPQDSSVLTLKYAEATVQGGKSANIAIPSPAPQEGKALAPGFNLFQKTNPSLSKLQVVIAAKVVKQDGGQTYLDESSLLNITSSAANGKISWTAPGNGEWKIIALWSAPDGEIPKAIASNPQGFVADPLDSNKVAVSYTHLFGPRTGLPAYYSRPLRAVFNDSYEFMADRHFEAGFLDYFKKQRGYDITPYLPANIQNGYNNAYASFLMPNQKPVYVFGDEDWRLRYDYDLTVSDLMRTQFIVPSDNWFDKKGMLHRTQAYGVKMDIIGNSGAADIPEAEQLAGANSEGFVKLITSGAHLYNKPVITQESFVFQGRAEMTTPQKIKLLADKAFAAGVNEIIYHGTPYKYQTGEYGEEGYNPFCSAVMPFINFSSDINESSPFWNDIKTVNQYITRVQYALRSGKSHSDVLVYFPFNNLDPSEVINNPGEIMPSGYFKGVEPESTAPAENNDKGVISEWYRQLWPVINKLEALGVTWEFVNDASLQQAKEEDDKINIRGNTYEALIVANAPYMQLPTAQNVAKLAQQKITLLAIGDAPSKQPSFLNYAQNDAATKRAMADALKQRNAGTINSVNDLATWVKGLHIAIRFNNEYNFTRQAEREMSDGSRLQFIWNMSDKWQPISLAGDKGFKGYYFIDAETGSITSVENSATGVGTTIKPYGSIILYAAREKLPEETTTPAPDNMQSAVILTKLDSNWTIKAGTAVANKSTLFDWRDNPSFAYQDKASYKTSFNLAGKGENNKYYIDMGAVYYTADVYVNNKHMGEKIWAPYLVDITQFLKLGINNIEILVTPTNRNVFIGEAIKGNAKYVQFKGAEKTLMPAGLIGPVSIKVVQP